MKKLTVIVLSLVLLLGLCSVAQAAVDIPVNREEAFLFHGSFNAPEFTTPVIESIVQNGNQFTITLSGITDGHTWDSFDVMFEDTLHMGGFWISSQFQGNTVTVTAPDGYPNPSIFSYNRFFADDEYSIVISYDSKGKVSDYAIDTTIYDEKTKEYNDYYWNYTADGKLYREYITSKYEAYFYAGSGLLSRYSYYPDGYDGDLLVDCSPDGTVTQVYYWAKDGDYFWDRWTGWYGTDSDGNVIDVDASTLPSIESLTGPELIPATKVSQEDVEIPLSASAANLELPLALDEIPAVVSAKLENGKLTIVTSKNLDALSSDQHDLWVFPDIRYMYEFGDDIIYAALSDQNGSYDPATNTFTVDLPEGATLLGDPYITVLYQVDNLYFDYISDHFGVSVSTFDDYIPNYGKNYQYNADGKLEFVTTFVSEDFSISVYFDENGQMDSYEYSIDNNATAIYMPDGTLDYVWYYDMETATATYWDEQNGWHTRFWDSETETVVYTPTDAPDDAVDPTTLKPLIIVVTKPKHDWYPMNTLGLAALSMKDLGISSDWHNVAPVDLTTDGTTVFTLVGGDAWILGNAYVTVADGNVTVTYDVYEGHGYMKAEKLNWFLSKDDLTEENLKADSNYAFGQPVSIAEDLKGAEIAILFIDSKITFRQPYFDAYNFTTRYYRNRENWKEYREGLIEILGE